MEREISFLIDSHERDFYNKQTEEEEEEEDEKYKKIRFQEFRSFELIFYFFLISIRMAS